MCRQMILLVFLYVSSWVVVGCFSDGGSINKCEVGDEFGVDFLLLND